MKTIETLSKEYHVIVLGWNRNGEDVDTIIKSINLNDAIDFLFFNEVLKHGSGIKGAKKQFEFLLWIDKTIKSIDDIFAIHACDFDTAIGVVRLANKRKIPVVYDIYDYYVEAHGIPAFLKNYVEKKEIEIINNSSCTIICTEQRKNQIKKSSPRKIVIIENTPRIDLKNIKIDGNKIKSKIRLVYVGVLMNNRLLAEILKVIEDYPQVQLCIGGVGELEESVKELSKNSNQIFYYGKMSYPDVLKLESSADFLFATYNPKIPNHKFSAANKVYEAMALGKPIIVCEDTGMDKLVEKENIGWVIKYDAKEFFETVIDKNKNPDLIKKTCENSREAYIREHSWKIMEERLLNIYREIK
jgi:glycosyltransferase involved in cell wall biosynthesis